MKIYFDGQVIDVRQCIIYDTGGIYLAKDMTNVTIETMTPDAVQSGQERSKDEPNPPRPPI